MRTNKLLNRFATRQSLAALTAAFSLAVSPSPAFSAILGPNGTRHVFLISIDGMHALDFANCTNGLAGVNGGAPYCPNLAALGQTGINYKNTSASKPSDSFPGLTAIVSGGSPALNGALYDVAYDRSLAPPAKTTGNGVAAGTCTPGVLNGTTTEYEEGISFDQTQLNGRSAQRWWRCKLHRPGKTPARPHEELRAGLPLEFCSCEHDFRSDSRGRRLHRLVR